MQEVVRKTLVSFNQNVSNDSKSLPTMGHGNNFEHIMCVKLCITRSLKMNMILINFFFFDRGIGLQLGRRLLFVA